MTYINGWSKMVDTPHITIGVINYNGSETLPETLQALQCLEYPSYDVLLVDDASTDGSLELVRQEFPEVQVLALPQNRGSAAARNAVLRAGRSEYVLILDNDIVLARDALRCLVDTIRLSPRFAVCHAELADPNDPDVYHYNGGWNHYVCALVSRPRPAPGEPRPQYEVFPVTGGAAVLLDREVALRMGGFDEDYFFNMEDGDFTTRLTLAGYLVLNVPGAVALHRGKPRGTSKAFYQVRNRWFYMLKLYSTRTLVLAGPALLIYELMQLALLLSKGAGREYLRANLAVVGSLPSLMRKRRAFRKLKVKRDRDWLRSGELYIPASLRLRGAGAVLKLLLELFFNAYWSLIRPFC